MYPIQISPPVIADEVAEAKIKSLLSDAITICEIVDGLIQLHFKSNAAKELFINMAQINLFVVGGDNSARRKVWMPLSTAVESEADHMVILGILEDWIPEMTSNMSFQYRTELTRPQEVRQFVYPGHS